MSKGQLPCLLRLFRRIFVINRLFYDACSPEKSQVLIWPQENISFDSIGFNDTLRFSSLRGRNFEPEEIADIVGNNCTGCSGCKG